jgi:hypothetical protein
VKFDFRVEELVLPPGGRDAIVLMEGRLDAGVRDVTVAYRIALDGRSAPRMMFRVDDSVRVHTSRAGAIFAVREGLDPV